MNCTLTGIAGLDRPITTVVNTKYRVQGMLTWIDPWHDHDIEPKSVLLYSLV